MVEISPKNLTAPEAEPAYGITWLNLNQEDQYLAPTIQQFYEYWAISYELRHQLAHKPTPIVIDFRGFPDDIRNVHDRDQQTLLRLTSDPALRGLVSIVGIFDQQPTGYQATGISTIIPAKKITTLASHALMIDHPTIYIITPQEDAGIKALIEMGSKQPIQLAHSDMHENLLPAIAIDQAQQTANQNLGLLLTSFPGDTSISSKLKRKIIIETSKLGIPVICFTSPSGHKIAKNYKDKGIASITPKENPQWMEDLHIAFRDASQTIMDSELVQEQPSPLFEEVSAPSEEQAEQTIHVPTTKEEKQKRKVLIGRLISHLQSWGKGE